jgi:predicted component of type VI protein secretion system
MFDALPTPISIGREEGNVVQLNDERISRYHLKIQEDQNKLVLTDLESTNGTKVNGETVQLWLLRHGDVITVGRSVLLFGSQEEIAVRLASLRGVDLSAGALLDSDEEPGPSPVISLESEFRWGDNPDAQAALHTLIPPELPSALSPGQAAQLSELLQYLHLRMRSLAETVKVNPGKERVTLEQRQWQNFLDLYDRVAKYLRAVGEPDL